MLMLNFLFQKGNIEFSVLHGSDLQTKINAENTFTSNLFLSF